MLPTPPRPTLFPYTTLFRSWRGNPSSAAVVYRFLQFDGVGPKIATMATNILARDFKIPMSDYYSVDISTDVHILRVLRRSGRSEEHTSELQSRPHLVCRLLL